MNSGNLGGSTRKIYDECAYKLKNKRETDPFLYRMSMDNFENENKCIYDKNSFYHPWDVEIVDTESELKGIKRKATNCNEKEYPGCDTCINTFDPKTPVVLAQEVCPIVYNNIQKMKGPGYDLKIDDVANRNVSRR
jgi:hypothetical protein